MFALLAFWDNRETVGYFHYAAGIKAQGPADDFYTGMGGLLCHSLSSLSAPPLQICTEAALAPAVTPSGGQIVAGTTLLPPRP